MLLCFPLKYVRFNSIDILFTKVGMCAPCTSYYLYYNTNSNNITLTNNKQYQHLFPFGYKQDLPYTLSRLPLVLWQIKLTKKSSAIGPFKANRHRKARHSKRYQRLRNSSDSGKDRRISQGSRRDPAPVTRVDRTLLPIHIQNRCTVSLPPEEANSFQGLHSHLLVEKTKPFIHSRSFVLAPFHSLESTCIACTHSRIYSFYLFRCHPPWRALAPSAAFLVR